MLGRVKSGPVNSFFGWDVKLRVKEPNVTSHYEQYAHYFYIDNIFAYMYSGKMANNIFILIIILDI